MSGFEKDDGLEELLGAAMRGRAEAAGGLRGGELAAAAMARAAAEEAHGARMAKVARWMRMTSMAAGLLLVLAMGVGIYLYRASATGDETTLVDNVGEAIDEGVSVAATTTTLDMATVGWMLMGAVVVGLVLKVVMVPERQGFVRMGYA